MGLFLTLLLISLIGVIPLFGDIPVPKNGPGFSRCVPIPYKALQRQNTVLDGQVSANFLCIYLEAYLRGQAIINNFLKEPYVKKIDLTTDDQRFHSQA